MPAPSTKRHGGDRTSPEFRAAAVAKRHDQALAWTESLRAMALDLDRISRQARSGPQERCLQALAASARQLVLHARREAALIYRRTRE